MNPRWLVVSAAAGVFLALWASIRAAEQRGPEKDAAVEDAASQPGAAGKKFVLTEPAVFDMGEVLAFGKREIPGGWSVRYPSGQYAGCSTSPHPDVKAYPKLKSKRPLYGSVAFPGITYYFVLDESGEGEKKAHADAGKSEKQSGEPQEKKSAHLAAAASRVREEPKCSYDLLYFDLNGDRDLTNDGAIKVAEKPVFELAGVPESPSVRYFNEVAVPLDFGAPVGKRPFALVPRVRVRAAGSAYVVFIPKMARRGRIRLAGQEYIVSLTQSTSITGRYDRRLVLMEVLPVDRKAKAALTSGPLAQMQVVDDQFLTVSASPLGDKLTITPYRGEFGTVEIGPGARAITEFGAVGCLMGRKSIVPLGYYYQAPEASPRRYKVPVGDYTLIWLTARYGRLRFSARMMPTGTSTAGPSFPIQIRKDKPLVLEFSGKPEVKFMDPAKDRSFKPGDEINIRATLNEPFQAVQITGLWDATKKTGTSRYVVDGRVGTRPVYARLDPTMVIQNSSGEKVAEGKMPFGSGGTCGYSWRVAKDLRLSGQKETFTATLTCDTLDLYGKVEAKLPITVEATP